MATITFNAQPKAAHADYSPVSGLVGHCFIRFCLWVDLVTSWKRRVYVAPEAGFPNFAPAEIAAAKAATDEGTPVALAS